MAQAARLDRVGKGRLGGVLMAKTTITLTALYDDGKAVKEPGDTVTIDGKIAQQLVGLGMAVLSAGACPDAPASAKPAKKSKGKQNAAAVQPPQNPENPTIPDPDAFGDE